MRGAKFKKNRRCLREKTFRLTHISFVPATQTVVSISEFFIRFDALAI